MSMEKRKDRVPDTAHNCPILRIGVVHNQPASERENLWKGELFYFLCSLLLHHKTTVISIKIWYRMEKKTDQQGLAYWCGDDRQVSQSGKPLCTGASLWAVPKLARGLCPLEPRHVNNVSITEKCPLDIPQEHLLIDQDLSPLPLRSAQS